MFWLERLKRDEHDESSWALSYGDLMSLLLAVFVMIAAMSELRSGVRFHKVGGAVRTAFGFKPTPREAELLGLAGARRPLTLVERLAQAGLARSGVAGSLATDEEILAPCDVVTQPDRLVIRIAGPASFAPYSAQLRPAARLAIARLAEFLIDGRARLEVRGHNGDGTLPADVAFRDGLDLSYARARAVADELTAAGVPNTRLHVTAWGDSDPLVTGADDRDAGTNRRIEIIVHAVAEGARPQVIAEKERVDHG